MSEFQPKERELSAARLIGHLLRGAEGQPIRYADLPQAIDISGPLLNRAERVWELSQNDEKLSEFSFKGFTRGDRKLHLENEPEAGNPERVVRRLVSHAETTTYVVGIHSHAIKDTPPSDTDIMNLLQGRSGFQAEIIATETAYFLVLRTDKTPIFTDIEKLKDKVQQIASEKHQTLSQNHLYEVLAISDPDPDQISDIIHKHQIEGNRFNCQVILDICEALSIGLYFSSRNNTLQRVHTVEDLNSYLLNLQGRIDGDTEYLLRKRLRSLNPDLRRVDPASLSPELLTEVVALVNEYLPQVEAYLTKSISTYSELLEAYKNFNENQEERPEITEAQLAALILEEGDYDPEDGDISYQFASTSGVTNLLLEMNLVIQEDKK